MTYVLLTAVVATDNRLQFGVQMTARVGKDGGNNLCTDAASEVTSREQNLLTVILNVWCIYKSGKMCKVTSNA